MTAEREDPAEMTDATTCDPEPARRRGGMAAIAVVAVMALLFTVVPAASAEDRIYWTEGAGTTIGSANLDGTGAGADFAPGGTAVFGPDGVVFDTAAGRMYWANSFDDTIWRASIDGSGTPSQLATTGAATGGISGLAIDTAAQRLYFPAFGDDSISSIRLGGAGGAVLDTTGATVDGPNAVAIDPVGRRIFWTNANGGAVSFANLDGSGGGDIPMGTPSGGSVGIALDVAGGRVYWLHPSTSTIRFSNLDGSGSPGTIDVTGVPAEGWTSLAIDAGAGFAYIGSLTSPGAIFRVALDGGAGAELYDGSEIAGVTLDTPIAVAILPRPMGTAAPIIIKSVHPDGRTRHECSTGSWAEDLPGSHLYRAPTRFAYQWFLDGRAVSRATRPKFLSRSRGDIRCRVTATNEAGSTQLSSDALRLGIEKKTRGRAKKRVTFRLTSSAACTAQVEAKKSKSARVKIRGDREFSLEADTQRVVRARVQIKKDRKRGAGTFLFTCTDDAGNQVSERVKVKVRRRRR